MLYFVVIWIICLIRSNHCPPPAFLAYFFFKISHVIARLPVSTTSLSAEWAPADGGKWEEKDFESDLKKLEKEAEERLDAKISEMMSKVESTGSN